MKFVNDLLHAVNDGIDYFRSNSWHLFLLIVALYVLKGQGTSNKKMTIDFTLSFHPFLIIFHGLMQRSGQAQELVCRPETEQGWYWNG